MSRQENRKKQGRLRLFIQVAFTAIINGYALGFAKGQIYHGSSKMLCVPVLNCYSCPGALGACPIGALQSVLGGRGNKLSFYVLGTLMLFGVLFGRLICGFLCPFGLVQDLLHKLPTPKWTMPKRIDRPLRGLKYVVLLLLVVLFPMFLVNDFGLGSPYFCKWICPAGTLGGAFPLLLQNETLRSAIGGLFNWKVFVLGVVVFLSVIMPRPFCKYLCPLGAFYGIFNRFSFYQMQVDHTKCIDCKQCEQQCPMNVSVLENINSTECIRCGRCKAICPQGAIESGFMVKTTTDEEDSVALK